MPKNKNDLNMSFVRPLKGNTREQVKHDGMNVTSNC